MKRKKKLKSPCKKKEEKGMKRHDVPITLFLFPFFFFHGDTILFTVNLTHTSRQSLADSIIQSQPRELACLDRSVSS